MTLMCGCLNTGRKSTQGRCIWRLRSSSIASSHTLRGSRCGRTGVDSSHFPTSPHRHLCYHTIMYERHLYGSKCHRCADLLGSTHDVESVWWDIGPMGCINCSFCQERALGRLLTKVGWDAFSPEVREAIQALRVGKKHPLVDELRRELLDE